MPSITIHSPQYKMTKEEFSSIKTMKELTRVIFRCRIGSKRYPITLKFSTQLSTVSKTSKMSGHNPKLVMKKRSMTRNLNKNWDISKRNFNQEAENAVWSAFIVQGKEEEVDPEADNQENSSQMCQVNGLMNSKRNFRTTPLQSHLTKEWSNSSFSSKSRWCKQRNP